MDLSSLKRPEGAKKNRKRIGRGHSSGTGKTSGKGHKGQNSRSGGGTNPFFEGGQMPLIRRLPKFGFTNFARKHFAIVNLDQLSVFEKGSVVDMQALRDKNIVNKKSLKLLKILGKGELKDSFVVKANAFSKTAKAAIEKAGGTAEVLTTGK